MFLDSMVSGPLFKVARILGDNPSKNKMSFKNEAERYRYLHRFDGALYPKQISNRMLTTSLFMIIPAVLAPYYECYFLTVMIWMIFLCSINYWRRPQYGMRRNIDIFVANGGGTMHVLYGLYHCNDLGTAKFFCSLVPPIAGLYLLGKLAKCHGYLNLDSYFHCSVHLWFICSCALLYRELYSIQTLSTM